MNELASKQFNLNSEIGHEFLIISIMQLWMLIYIHELIAFLYLMINSYVLSITLFSWIGYNWYLNMAYKPI